MAKVSQDQNLDVAVKLLADVATAEQIRALLRVAKRLDRDGTKVSGRTKSDLIDNLRATIGRGVPIEKIFALLNECEENGDQHIFYYMPTSSRVGAETMTAGDVRDRYFPQTARTANRLPRYSVMPTTYEWSDFRAEPDGSWTAKMHGQEQMQQRDGEPEQVGDKVTVVYSVVPVRTVLVARRHADGLFEVRVPRMERAEQIASMRDRMLDAFEDLFSMSELPPWDLSRAKRRLKAEEEQHADVYMCGQLAVCEASGRNCILQRSTHEDDESGDACTTLDEAVRQVLADGATCRLLKVFWKPTKANRLPKGGLSTILGSSRADSLPNEVIVPRKTSPQAIDYVTQKLRHFSA